MSDQHRWPQIMVTAPRDIGFIVWSEGSPIAALTSRAELANWVERHFGDIPGEREREEEERKEMMESLANVEAMPNVLGRPRTEPRKGLWRRG